MNNEIIVCSNDNAFIIEHLYTVENYCTFKIVIKSGAFKGESNFCIPKEYIVSNLELLKEISFKMQGKFEIKDYDTDANLNFEFKKFGQMDIYGQIGGSHEENYMVFRFNSDQTALNRLFNYLKTILNK